MIDIGALRKCKLLESKNNLYDSLQIPAFLCVVETWQKIIYIPQKFGLIRFCDRNLALPYRRSYQLILYTPIILDQDLHANLYICRMLDASAL